MMERTTRIALALVLVAFAGFALLFLPRLGIEADEAMVGNGIYEHGAPWYSWHIGGAEIPVMLISYLGALKTWLYNPWFLIAAPGPVTLRLPNIVLGLAALALFFALLNRVAGRVAALAGTALLATDSAFLLIEATDFGFVALQFVFKLSAILLLLRFARTGSLRALFLAFFLLGLAMWDKAVFAWVLFGLGAAALAVFPREILKALSWRNATVAAAAMSIGALPLLIYNIARPLETLRSNVKVAREPVLAKASLLTSTMDGYVMFGFLTAADPGPVPGTPRHWYQSLSLRLADWTGHPQRNLTLGAAALAMAALPFLWNTPARRAMLFGWIACAATWLPMALTAGAGAAAQHVILLWPFHFLAIAAALSQLSPRWAQAAAAVLCLSNLAVTNQYYADLVRNGPAIRWTDSIDPLNRWLADSKSPRVFTADWGFAETLNLISQGATPVFSADTSDRAAVLQTLASPRDVFVSHTPEFTFRPEIRAAIETIARENGFEEERLAVISDRNGRPTFDVFRFRKVHL
jgi:dolichyl-phosphate-mannose-protein mannosyltransferase